MIKLIAAASLNGVIGRNQNLPWDNDFPEDLKFFRKMTSNSTVIMGRKTFDSIGKALPNRRNIVLTHKIVPKFNAENVEIFHSLDTAIEKCEGDIWVIGGSFVYQEALRLAEEIYITTIPKFITGDGLVYFPYVNPDAFEIKDRIELSKEKNLYCNVYRRKCTTYPII
jgi:dihydrofolate reductase